MAKKAAKLIVNGTVQGVFFRQFVKENAEKLSLTGYARNLDSGEVEIVIEGEKEKIESFAGIVKEGPKHAQIRNVSFEEKKWSGEFKDFKVLRF
ncbi:MAG: acylphosphatase [archaeon]|nr:acylphosphatase [archaeon]MCR4323362.1 acylphosphatase [Nanoarchaeota archaeon]